MEQTDARRAAQALNEGSSTIYVAAPVPLGAWGGAETGWDVFAYPEMRPLIEAERARLESA